MYPSRFLASVAYITACWLGPDTDTVGVGRSLPDDIKMISSDLHNQEVVSTWHLVTKQQRVLQ